MAGKYLQNYTVLLGKFSAIFTVLFGMNDKLYSTLDTQMPLLQNFGQNIITLTERFGRFAQ